MGKILEVKNLTVHIKTHKGVVQAVRGVDFYLNEQETLAVVGESGSGKSITMKGVMGILPKNGKVVDGTVMFQGNDLTKYTERQMQQVRGSEIAMIFQDPMTSLNPTMKVGKQIEEMLKEHRKEMSKADRKTRAIELLSLVGISNPEARYDQYPHQLSGGMRQRVVIAIALACDPKVLIADEPTTALDVTIQAQILDLMRDLQKKIKTSIIIITHNLGVVAEICDKVSVMYAGKMVEQGPVDDIFYNPGHPYTKGLLRSMPRVDAESYERLIPIEGSPVDMLNPPEGCPFAPRCEHAMKICLQKMPPYVELGENHRAACWLCVQDCLEEAKKVDTQTENIEKTEVDNHE